MNIIYFLSSLLLYLFAPSVYNHAFCGLITILFLIQTIPFVIKKSKGNFINFYSLFFLSFFFTNFFYPAVLYPINPKFFSVFSYPFNQAYINGGTALAQLSAILKPPFLPYFYLYFFSQPLAAIFFQVISMLSLSYLYTYYNY
jgi:hypothetical protein